MGQHPCHKQLCRTVCRKAAETIFRRSPTCKSECSSCFLIGQSPGTISSSRAPVMTWDMIRVVPKKGDRGWLSVFCNVYFFANWSHHRYNFSPRVRTPSGYLHQYETCVKIVRWWCMTCGTPEPQCYQGDDWDQAKCTTIEQTPFTLD